MLLFFGLIVAAIFYYGRAFFDRLDHLIGILAPDQGSIAPTSRGPLPLLRRRSFYRAKFCPRCGARLG